MASLRSWVCSSEIASRPRAFCERLHGDNAVCLVGLAGWRTVSQPSAPPAPSARATHLGTFSWEM